MRTTTTTKLLAAAAVAGVVATGGSAYTAGITMKSQQDIGAGSQSVSGATASSIDYQLSTDGQTVNSVTVTFVGDQSDQLVESSINAATRTACSQVGTFQSGSNTSTFSCAGAQTGNVTSFSLLVTDKTDSNVSLVAS